MRTLKIEEIYLKDIRQFSNHKINFCQNINVLIGKNGCGKSTILKSIYLAQLTKNKNFIKLLNPLSETYVSQRSSKGQVELKYFDIERRTNINIGLSSGYVKNEYVENIDFTRSHSDELVVLGAYGASRSHVKGSFREDLEKMRTLSLEEILGGSLFGLEMSFENPNNVFDSKAYYSENLKKLHRDFFSAYLELFDYPEKAKIVEGNDGIIAIDFQDGNRINFYNFSDGEKTIFCIVLDILNKAAEFSMFNDDIKGVVLIDELEHHLHPKLQGDVLAMFAKMFPNVQFILTTHSPHVALNAPLGSKIIKLSIDKAKKLLTIHEDLVDENFERRFTLVSDILVSDKFFSTALESKHLRTKLEKHIALCEVISKYEKLEQIPELLEKEMINLSLSLIKDNILQVPNDQRLQEVLIMLARKYKSDI